MKDIITHSENLEKHLIEYKEQIGGDYAGYRGHLYRVLNYFLYLSLGDKTHQDLIEFTLVYHDLGLWTDQELAYLEPSISLALKVNKEKQLGYDEQLLRDLIFYHHKITPFKGAHADLINAFRKADWVDASKGKLSKGIPAHFITEVKEKIPAQGFYETLDRLGPELTNGKKLKIISEFMKVFKW